MLNYQLDTGQSKKIVQSRISPIFFHFAFLHYVNKPVLEFVLIHVHACGSGISWSKFTRCLLYKLTHLYSVDNPIIINTRGLFQLS